ncbi:hypothetical protein cypCar_00029751 [Cyprinus carpio]|nr:hypothetical protein cypCar_00029751 [Cyprinus carpio]
MEDRRPQKSCDEAIGSLVRQEYEAAVAHSTEALLVMGPRTLAPSTAFLRKRALLYRIAARLQLKDYDQADEDCKHVFAEELGKGDGSFRAGLQSMLLDGSLQEVCSVLSKALYGEPLNGIMTKDMTRLKRLLSEIEAVRSNMPSELAEENEEGEFHFSFTMHPGSIFASDILALM